MKSQLEQQLQSALHTKNMQLSSSKKQVLLTQMQQSSTSRHEFFKDMCNWMVSANIPLFKLQMPGFRSFLKKYCKQHIPDQSTLRKHQPTCYEETLQNVRGNIGDAFIWVAVDETTDSGGRIIANLVAGKSDTEVPSNPHLICSRVLHYTNHSTVARFVNDGLKVLWPTGVYEEVLILYSDAVMYRLKAATALEVFYPNLIHFTCLAHGLQRAAEEVTAK
jgi:hypothetical protein